MLTQILSVSFKLFLENIINFFKGKWQVDSGPYDGFNLLEISTAPVSDAFFEAFFFNVFGTWEITKEELSGQKPKVPFSSQTPAGKQSKASAGPCSTDLAHQPPFIPAS